MIKDYQGITGDLRILVKDQNGDTKQEAELKNLVVTTGKNLMASRFVNAADTVIGYMAVGTGTTAANVADTALETEVARVAVTSTTRTGNVIEYVANYAAGVATGAITEAGLLNAAVAGTLSNRVVFSVINKGSLDTMTVYWTITFG